MDKPYAVEITELRGEISLVKREQVSFDRRIANMDQVLEMVRKEFTSYINEEREQHEAIIKSSDAVRNEVDRIYTMVRTVLFMVPIIGGIIGAIIVVVNWMAQHKLL